MSLLVQSLGKQCGTPRALPLLQPAAISRWQDLHQPVSSSSCKAQRPRESELYNRCLSFLSLVHLECICKHYALPKGKLYPKSSPFFFQKQNWKIYLYSCICGKSEFHYFFSPGTLPCLSMKVYKSILKYGILRMFQSKVKLVLKTLLVKAKITVWLNSLKCS